MSTIAGSIEIELPVRTVYDQWTQFEEFPRFMQGVERVRQISDSYLEWTAEVFGQRRTWAARIVEQVPDRLISWVSTEGEDVAGTVEFEPRSEHRTRVSLSMRFEPDGAVERMGDAARVVEMMIRDDLRRFKDFIESRGAAKGAWRGEIPPDGELAG